VNFAVLLLTVDCHEERLAWLDDVKQPIDIVENRDENSFLVGNILHTIGIGMTTSMYDTIHVQIQIIYKPIQASEKINSSTPQTKSSRAHRIKHY
jgi:hypothetical protein